MNSEYGIEPSPMAAQMFGNAAREHMKRYGTTKEQLAKIALKKTTTINKYLDIVMELITELLLLWNLERCSLFIHQKKSDFAKVFKRV